MKNKFKEMGLKDLLLNPFKLIGDDWTLITAGTADSCNTMTASWGGFGVLWNKPIAICFIRPTRHTYKFTEKSDYFTLSFFDESKRAVLDYCGSRSGKDEDKIKNAGLTKFEIERGMISFEEAKLIFVCRKIYYQDLAPENFLDGSIMKNYPKKDFHRAYFGEIIKALEVK